MISSDLAIILQEIVHPKGFLSRSSRVTKTRESRFYNELFKSPRCSFATNHSLQCGFRYLDDIRSSEFVPGKEMHSDIYKDY